MGVRARRLFALGVWLFVGLGGLLTIGAPAVNADASGQARTVQGQIVLAAITTDEASHPLTDAVTPSTPPVFSQRRDIIEAWLRTAEGSLLKLVDGVGGSPVELANACGGAGAFVSVSGQYNLADSIKSGLEGQLEVRSASATVGADAHATRSWPLVGSLSVDSIQPSQASPQQLLTRIDGANADSSVTASRDVEAPARSAVGAAAGAAPSGAGDAAADQQILSSSSAEAAGVMPDLVDEPALPGMVLGSADRPAMPLPSAPMRILFLIMRFCDGTENGPVTTAQEFESILFGNGSATSSSGSPESAAASIGFQSLFNYCGNGRQVLSAENVRILEDVRVPCTGNTSAATSLYGNYTWRTAGCAWPDVFGWGEAAAEQARARLGDAEFSKYKHVVMLMPRGWKAAADPECANFVSGAEVGVWRRTAAGQPAFALTAVSDERYNEAALYLHELLHNFNLWHSGGYDATGAPCEYCDWSCVLGWCCNVRCPNAPHMWSLGWAGPVAGGSMALSGLREGAVQSYRVPLQHTANDSMVIVDATDAAGKGLQYFLSYRRSGAVYERMYGTIDGVHVHVRYAGGAPAPIPQIGTMQLRRLPRAGAVWQDEDSRLMVSVLAMGTADATVTLCRAPLRTAVNSSTNSTSLVDWSACLQASPSAAAAARTAPPVALPPPSPEPPSPEPPSLPPPSPRRATATASKRAPPLPPFSSLESSQQLLPAPSPPSPAPLPSPHKRKQPPRAATTATATNSPSKLKTPAGRRRRLLRRLAATSQPVGPDSGR